MAEFEDKLNSILSNPALMSQIMSMAGNLGQDTQPSPKSKPDPPPQNPGGFGGMNLDPGALQNMMALLKSTQLDGHQQRLLTALQGYLPKDRLEKLSKAMQASKIARFASTAMNQGR